MITSFKHKGLALFFTQGSYKGIPAQHGSRIERMLDRLDACKEAEDMTCLATSSMRSRVIEKEGSLFQSLAIGESHLNLWARTPSTLTWRTITDEVSAKP
jgi:proteic killer suppression protein